MKTKTFIAVWGLAASLGLVLLAGCGKKDSSEPAATPTASAPAAPAATPIDPATAASISGTVKLDGEAPKAAKIDMSQDPACKGMNMAENVMASGGHLSNVFVYVKEGLGNRTFDVPKDVMTLDQSGCKYHSASGTSPSLPRPRHSKRPSPAKKSCSPSSATSIPGCACSST